MTTTETTTNKYLLKRNIEDFPQKQTLISPSFFYPQPINFGSNISEKKNNNGERLNGLDFNKAGLDFDNIGHAFLPGQSKYFRLPILLPMGIPSKFQSRISNDEDGNNNNLIYEPKNLILNNFGNERSKNNSEKKDENMKKNKIKHNYENNCNYFFNILNGHYNLKKNNFTPEKNINLNLNMNMNINTPINSTNNISNSGTKFFTNHNYGYKCSCSKTQCNRKYCECFNSGNYCIDCNCKNCNNKPPINSYTNKHPTDDSSKNKKEKIICTCTKSGCNKNYCECFKNGQKCSSLCRCISCENNDKINKKKIINNNYECCPANSIYIVKNNIIIESINKEKYFEKKFKNNFDICTLPTNKEYLAICKKRKREETKNNEENLEKMKKISKKSEEIELFNDSLFDKNGKVILRHINLIHM